MNNIQAFDFRADFPLRTEKTWKFDFYLFCPNPSIPYVPVESNHKFITDDTRIFIRAIESLSDSITTESLMHLYGAHADASLHIYCGLARQLLSCIEFDHVIVFPLGEDFLSDDLRLT